MPRVINVIESIVRRGEGTPESPVREVLQYHAVTGEFLAENDPVREQRRQLVEQPAAGSA